MLISRAIRDIVTDCKQIEKEYSSRILVDSVEEEPLLAVCPLFRYIFLIIHIPHPPISCSNFRNLARMQYIKIFIIS